MNCHKTLFRRILSYKTSVIDSFTHSDVFWKVFLSFCVAALSFPALEHWSKSEFVKIDTTMGAALDSDSLFVLATGFPVPDERWSEICWASSSHTNWTHLRKHFFEITTLLSLDLHCSVSMIFHLLCISKLLGTTDLFLRVEDFRFFWV